MKKNKIPKLVEWSIIHKMPRKNALGLFVGLFLFIVFYLYVSFPELLDILEVILVLIVGLLLIGYVISWMDDNDAWKEK